MIRYVRKVSVVGTVFEREFYILKSIKTLLRIVPIKIMVISFFKIKKKR